MNNKISILISAGVALLLAFTSLGQVAVRAPASATPNDIAVFGASPNIIVDGGSLSSTSGIATNGGSGIGNTLSNLTTAGSIINNGLGVQIYNPSNNTAIGGDSLTNLTTGSNNVAVGWQALAGDTSAGGNIAIGVQALESNKTGAANIAIGYQSQQWATARSDNVTIGNNTLSTNINSSQDVAVGFGALSGEWANKTGNVAVGYEALFDATNASLSTAIGTEALQNYGNVVNLDANSWATAIGAFSQQSMSVGEKNTSVGKDSLFGMLGGSNNVAIGQTSHGYQYAASPNGSIGSIGTTVVGALSGANTYLPNGTIIIGAGLDLPNSNAVAPLDIGDVIFGTGMYQATNGNGTTNVPIGGGAIGINMLPISGVDLSLQGSLVVGATVTATNGIASYALHTPVSVNIGSSPYFLTNPYTFCLACKMYSVSTFAVTNNGVQITASESSDAYTELQPGSWIAIAWTIGTPSLLTNAW